jgi:hypothetical protein
MKLPYALLLTTILALAGCPTTPSAVESANKQLAAQGSPFRYVSQGDAAMVMTLMPLPVGPTKAIEPLAKQALEAITAEEFRQGRSVANVAEVRHLQDGREVWVLQTLSNGLAYVVAFEAPARAGSNIKMKGPYSYQK